NGGPVRIDLLASDTGMLLQATGVTQPAHGTVVPGLDFGYFGPGRANAEVTYTPDPDFAGSDTFSYTVIDGNGQTATAHVNVTVVGTLPALAALDDGVVVPANSGPNPINVLGNDTGSGVHVTAVTQPAHGAAVILPSGIGVTYQPARGFAGTDLFTYTVTDAHRPTATATLMPHLGAHYRPPPRGPGPRPRLRGPRPPLR